jgi:hypothetical protein
MQKVIPLNKIDDYTVKGYLPKGFVSKANDTKHLKSYEDYYHGLRLDYKDKAGMYPFNIYDEGCYVIRFKARDSHLATPPIDTKSNSEFPFTDHGFTSANEGRLSCPEYEMENPAEVTEGVIYRVLPSGVEVPFAIFDETTSKFIEL